MGEASRSIQHMQKAVTKMNVQLANVLSDISGVSGQAIIEAILKGERDIWRLADLCDPGVKASREEVARSLEGHWREDVLFELQQAVDSYHFTHRQMQECDRKLEGYLASLPARMLDIPVQPEDTQAATPKKKTKKCKRPRRKRPHLGLKTELTRICGVGL